MTILFMGGEMGAFTPSDANAVEFTESATFNSSFARCSVGGAGSASYIESPEWTETDDIWIHFEVYQNPPVTSGTQTQIATFLNAAGTEVARITSDNPSLGGTQTWQLQYWNGSAWTNLGSSFTSAAGREVVDIHLVTNTASGSGSVYFSGTLRSTGSANLSTIAGVAQMRGYGKTSGIGMGVALSQVIVADEPTVGWRLFTVPVSGVGATSAWTGSRTEIDEISYSDADFISSGTADQVSTFAVTAPTLTGYEVRAVGVSARARCGSGGPQNLQLALRSSGADYFSSSLALDVAYGAFVNIWEENPATSAAWLNSAIASLQPGVKSIT